MREKDIMVDIIIPVYNALDDLKKCILSIIKYTDLEKHRVILIDDRSPNPEVKEYLDTLRETNIKILENEENIGFSATVNRGIALSDENDVILLNSDVLVTPEWVEKLIKCAYSDAGIATVTPLSNNASICSVPVSNQNNPLPDNMTLEEYAVEIERTSLKSYPSIPMAVGFCMYIKRSVIKEVGLFDSAAFGLGYGEENDYCNRATELGYRHAMCDDLFIYHKGTASFEENSRLELSIAHESILESRYPRLNRKLEWYWAYDQNSLSHKNVNLYRTLKLGKAKKNILFLIQADFQEGCSNNIGGTQLHVKDLVDSLKDEFNFFVVARDGGLLRVTAYIGSEIVPLAFPIGAVPPFYVYRNKEMADLYEDILKAFKIDLVHIHHTMGMTLEMYYAAEKIGIPIYTTLHDYYYICPTLRMLDIERKSCIGNIDWKKCKACMKNALGVFEEVEYLPKWRREHESVLKKCEKIFVPTKSAADIIAWYYPDIKGKMKVIGHGIDEKIFYKEKDILPYHHRHLRVAFVGGICETKGSEVIYKMITSDKDEFKWYIFGGIDGQELINLKQPNLVKTSWYRREELGKLLRKNEIDVVCILSKVAETFCYTLSEVVACGIPVIVTDIGALGERMREMQAGWIVSENANSEEVLNLLKQIKKNPEDYKEKWHIAQKVKVRSSKEMADDYRKIYAILEKQSRAFSNYNTRRILEGYLAMQQQELAQPPATSVEEIVLKNKQLEAELKMIYDSEIFKVMKKIAGILDIIKARL